MLSSWLLPFQLCGKFLCGWERKAGAVTRELMSCPSVKFDVRTLSAVDEIVDRIVDLNCIGIVCEAMARHVKVSWAGNTQYRAAAIRTLYVTGIFPSFDPGRTPS